MNAMKAMLLAAGKGERLGTVWRGLPKVLLPVAGRPILEHNLLYLRRAGVRRVVINLHHRPQAIRSFLAAKKNFGLHVTFSHERELLGTAGAVKKVERLLRSAPFLVLYGDNLLDFDIAGLWREHARSGALVTVGVFHPRAARFSGMAAGLIQTDESGRITTFVEKRNNTRVPAGAWANAGIYVVSPAVLRDIPQAKPYDFARDLFPKLLARRARLQALPGASYVLASDTVTALARTRAIARSVLTKRPRKAKKSLVKAHAT